MEKFDAESQERKDMERRLASLVDDRFSILRNELNKEARNRNESVENFTFYLEVRIEYYLKKNFSKLKIIKIFKYTQSEVPKIVEQMKNEQIEREEGDNHINKSVIDEFTK